MLYLGLTGVVVVIALFVVAWRLWRRVWQNEADLKARQKEVEANEIKRLDHIHQSINVIAAALIDDQVRVAEAGIRMAVLLDNLPLSCDSKHRFAAIFEVYNRTQHIPTHTAWNELDKKQRRAYEQELFALESELGEQVKEAARYIKENPFGIGQPHEVTH
ncbi:MAG: DUF2489 domain-containing protein [Pseudomonadales bacterium]|nr:DUF2489 domain-containing protein [Pseudomonadales bacterium]